MSELGALASRYDSNSKSLRDFDEALRVVRKGRKLTRSAAMDRTISSIEKVVRPVAQCMENGLAESVDINENKVIEIMKTRHSRDWPVFRNAILKLDKTLGATGDINISDEDVVVLNEIANALDAECNRIFQKMGEGK